MSEVYGDRDNHLTRREPDPEVVEGQVVDAPGAGAVHAAEMVARFRAFQARPSSCIGGIALTLLCLLVFLPGFFALPPVDRDEARFAQASRQMYESIALAPAAQTPALHDGGLIIPKQGDRPRLNKPPLIYWLQITSAIIFTGGNPYRDAIWMYRIPSLIAAIVTVLAVYRLGTRMFDRRTGWLAAALLAVAPVMAWEAHQARADMVLLACTTIAMAALSEFWRASLPGPARRIGEPEIDPEPQPSARTIVTFWIAVSLGILTKGPITPLIIVLAAITLAALSGRWRWLLSTKPLLGIPLALLPIALWAWAVADKVGWNTYLSTITGETLGRSIAAKEGHWGPPGYHTILLPVLFWPGSLLTAAGIALAWRAARAGASGGGLRQRLRWNVESGGGAYAFCLAWILPSWILFELITTKLPHYTMPLYPAIALLSARAVLAADAGALPAIRERAGRIGFGIWFSIGGILLLAAAAALIMRVTASPSVLGRMWFSLITVILLSIAFQALRWTLKGWRSGKHLRTQLAGIVAAAIAIMSIVGLAMPVVNDLPRQLREALIKADPNASRPIAAMVYHEDSLIYSTRARARRIDEDKAGEWWRNNPDGLMVLPTSEVLRIHRPVAEVSGFNIAKGRVERLSIVEMVEIPR